MREEIFNAVYPYYKNSDGHTKFWPELAERFNYENGEKLRDAFKKERKRRGITSRNDNFSAEKQQVRHNNCKILLIDLESSPILGMVWGMYDQNLSYDRIIQDWHLLCWSAKWLFDSEVMSDVLTQSEAKNHDDKRICESAWKLLNEANVIIAHNGNQFDVKKFNARFIKHGLNPPSAYQKIDTLLVARNGFGFTSNKLDDLCAYFGLPKKTDTNFDLWKKCFYGDKEALEKMSSYCSNDVFILEELYLKLRGWIVGHPNLNLWNEDNVSVCPNCGGRIIFGGDYYTPVNRYDAWRCSDCGAIGRSKKNNLDKEKSRSIVRN